MTVTTATRFRSRVRLHRSRAQGVALVSTLLLLVLLTALTIAMALAVSSDTLINGYYRNFRGAFYASDAGSNVARQDMVNRIVAAVPATFDPATSPIPAGTDANVQAAILSSYGGWSQINSGDYAGRSWPGSFRITGTTLTLATFCAPQPCAPPPYTARLTDAMGNVTGYQYIYNYSLTSLGQAQGGEQTRITDKGSLIINATLVPAGGVRTSFAAWGTFYDQYPICSAPLVAGTLAGPVFTNDALTFGNRGPYIFTDAVGMVSPNAGYYFSPWGRCFSSPTSSYTFGRQTIAPTFQAGLNLGQPRIPLPINDYDQKWAVLDGRGRPPGRTLVTTVDLNANLLDINGNPYPVAGTTSGVWLPYSVVASPSCPAPPCFTGGGIYVEGDANVTLASSGTSAEVYTITQGLTTTTITVDLAANTTTIFDGTTTKVIPGVPNQKDPTTGAVLRPATMLYVNGNIPSLSGPGEGIPAVNDGQAITITAVGTFTVTGDLLYKTPPVTKTQNDPCCPGTPAGTLIPGNDRGQVLGLFTATGDIAMNNLQASGNLEIDAAMATISEGGTGGLTNVLTWINTLTIVGGRVQNRAKRGNITTRNIFFDRRFSQGGFAPPWFPSTTVTAGGVASATVTSSVQRVKWLNCTAFDLHPSTCQ